MKQLFFFICLGLFLIKSCIGQGIVDDRPCDIIQNQYFQKVVTAEVDFYSEHFLTAYQILNKLDSSCGLTNSVIYQELFVYARVSLLLNETASALNAIKRLVCDYGYSLSDFKGCANYLTLKKSKDWLKFKREILSLSQTYVSDTATFSFFDKIIESDQDCRRKYIDSCALYQADTAKLIQFKNSYLIVFDSVDNINCQKLISFLTANSNRKFYLSNNHRKCLYFGLLAVTTHLSNSDKADSLLYAITEQIKIRNLTPEFYAGFVDRQKLNANEKYIYGFYDNANPNKIEDFQNIDVRRLSIGLPSYGLEKQLKQIKKSSNQ